MAQPVVITSAAIALLLSLGTACAQTNPVIGLITKTEANPFFVKMREGAQSAANSKGARLLTGAGRSDGDNAGQVTAMENMIAAGAKAIVITPNDSKAIVPAIKRARDKGVLVIALDSPTEPAHFWVDPVEEVVAVMMIQTPIRQMRPEFENAVMQAIVQ